MARRYSSSFIIIIVIFMFPATGTLAAEKADSLHSFQEEIIAVSNRVKPLVVHIKALLNQRHRTVEATGSGLIVDTDGHIVTNYHVVDRAQSIEVTVYNRKKPIKATIRGLDKQTDLALLRLEENIVVQPPTFANSDEARVGEWVLAIGNPYGLEGTVSFGIVSAKGRNLPMGGVLNDFIQTDAMIDFGSSGGPLMNLKGEILGINSRTQGRGIGFTIPANVVLKVKDKLLKEGNIKRAWLGATVQPITRELADYLGLGEQRGVIVNSLLDDSPALKAGLRPGDIVVRFDGQEVGAADDKELVSVIRTIANAGVGKRVSIEFYRQSKKKQVWLKLGEQPKTEDTEFAVAKLGFSVQGITTDLFLNYRLETKKGVMVSFVENGSSSDQAGLVRGDVIESVQKKTTAQLSQFKHEILKVENAKRIFLVVRRGRNLMYLLLNNEAFLAGDVKQ